MPPASTSLHRDQPLPLRIRPDLRTQPQVYQGRRCWLVTDPLSLKYYRFEEEEHFLLSSLDGKTSIEELITRFQERFAPQRINSQELQQLLGQLHRSGLVLSERGGQGAQLYQRSRKKHRQQLLQQFANPLAIRFRGLDPERLLAAIEPWTRCLFSPLAFVTAGLLMLTALALVLTQFEQFWSRLPTMQEFFAGRNWLSLALVLGLTKVCHELGHALTSRRYGGQCHELGLMLLVFTPCLYANVSDSWRLNDKWKRMAISFAGIYVELLLAACATIVWWATLPGLINQLALNVMFICSVGTLLFNANPLMKYDGYYLLADWLEIPNLKQRASEQVTQALSHWLSGLPVRSAPWQTQSRRWLLWTYALASLVYRWLMTFGIIWLLCQVLEPWGLQIMGQGLALCALLGLIIPPARNAYRYLSVPGRWNAMKRTRLVLSVATCLALVGVLLLLPLPYCIRCPFFFQPVDARQVYVETPGIVAEVLAQPGDQVEAGQPIVRLRAPELDVELAQLQGELAAAEAQLKIAQTWSSSDEAVASQLPAMRAAVLAAQRQRMTKQKEAGELTIVAPATGRLLPAHRRSAPPSPTDKLEQWSGQPLKPRQAGHFLESQTSLGTIYAPEEQFEAILLVSQEETEPLMPGQSVQLWLNSAPGTVLRAMTGELSAQPVESIPAALALKLGGEIPTQTDANLRERPLNPRYQVAAVVVKPQPDSESATTLSGATGVAFVQVGYRSLASRLWRWALQTFHFEP